MEGVMRKCERKRERGRESGKERDGKGGMERGRTGME